VSSLRKKAIRCLSILLLGAMIMPMTVYTKADIEEEREKQEQIEQSITDVQATLDELESVKNDTTAYITEMDAK
jgi:Mn2+/Fe2+ NRAMP family transporter